MKKTLVFDWDGTLHETAALYGNAVRTAYAWLVNQGAASEYYYSDEEISKFLGMSAPDMWATFMPNLEESLRKEASAMIGREMIDAISRGEAHLYPHTEEVLTKLSARGHKIIFLSNCGHSYLVAHRDYFKLDRWFCDYYAAEDYGFIPKKDIFQTIRERHNGDFIMIGDRASDMAVATTHGFSSIGCAYGYGKPEELETATRILHAISDLPLLIDELD